MPHIFCTDTYISFCRNPRKFEYGADTRCTYCLSSTTSQWHRDKKMETFCSVRCDQCGTASTSQWHRDQRGQTSCSACYHYTRRHGQPRPTDKRWVWVIELETNPREVSQLQRKASTKAFFWLKADTWDTYNHFHIYDHGIMGTGIPEGGLLRYRKWVPQQLLEMQQTCSCVLSNKGVPQFWKM